jgi:hypothetical protein
MSEFLQTILSFPTVVWTVLLGVVLLYWVLVILGALDIDVLHVDADASADADVDVGDAGHHGGFASVVDALGIAGVPVTITASFWILAAWFLSVAGRDLLGSLTGGVLGGAALFVAAAAIGLFAAAMAVRPMKGFFAVEHAPKRESLVGKTCTVGTARVDARTGQARIEEGPNVYEVPIRCLQDNALGRGQTALIIEYDPAEEIYLVVPMDEILGELPAPAPDEIERRGRRG